MTRVVFHIERLVLHGFPAADGAAFARGLQAELARLFAEPNGDGLLALGGHHVARLRAGSIQAAPGADPAQLGAQAARRIGAGLRP